MAEAPTDPLDPNVLFAHVEDATEFHFPYWHPQIPQPLHALLDWMGIERPLFSVNTGQDLIDRTIQPLDFTITKFMVIQVIAAVLVSVFFIGLAKALRGGALPRGNFRNMLEVMLLFFRDKVARPCIGHDADRYMPFLWTMFFFVLACNLFGMIPWMGSPTGALATTAMLALITFVVVIGSGMAKLGGLGFFKAQVPHMDLAFPLKLVLVPMIFAIEIFGLLVKHAVLAVRLLANMTAGHVILTVIIAFIAASAHTLWWFAVMPSSLIGAVALSLLELFVAFLQAFIFTFLSALFIGMAVHPH